MAPAPARRIPLGRSFAMDDGDLTLVGGTLVMVEDLRALHQALALTIETQLGSDPINTTHGFDLLALGEGSYGVRTRTEFLKLHLARTVASDRRVKDIRELIVAPESAAEDRIAGRFRAGDFAFVTVPAPAPKTEGGLKTRRYRATVVIETADGDTLSLEIGAIRA